MLATVIIGLIAILGFTVFAWLKRRRKSGELARHSISPKELHDVIGSGREVLLFDVRQPLDILAYPELIPGARRIPPDEVLQNPRVIPQEKDVVVYCTCPSDKTSRMVLDRALAVGFSSIKFLRGGLAAWKDSGFAVEPYTEKLAFSSPANAASKT